MVISSCSAPPWILTLIPWEGTAGACSPVLVWIAELLARVEVSVEALCACRVTGAPGSFRNGWVRAHHHRPSTQETEHLETSFSPKVLKLLESCWHKWVAKLVSTISCKGGNSQPDGEGKFMSDLLPLLASPVPCVAACPSFMAWSLGRSLQRGVQG